MTLATILTLSMIALAVVGWLEVRRLNRRIDRIVAEADKLGAVTVARIRCEALAVIREQLARDPGSIRS